MLKLIFKIELLERLQKNPFLSNSQSFFQPNSSYQSNTNINNTSNINNLINHKTNFEEFQTIKISEHSLSNKHNINNTFLISSNNNNKNNNSITSNNTNNNNNSQNKFNLNTNYNINQTIKYPHSKYSMRNSKIYTGDVESFPFFEKLTKKLKNSEKENLINFLKTIDSPSLINTFNLINKKNYYVKLKSKQGLESIKNSYYSHLKIFDAKEEIEDENEMFIILKNILNINEILSSEIFNLFKFNEFHTFNVKHFVLLIFLLIAIECDSLIDFFLNFSEEIFKEISNGQNFITVAKMKKIASIIGISEKIINNCLDEFGFMLFNDINEKNFKEFYLKLAKTISKENNNNNNNNFINNNSLKEFRINNIANNNNNNNNNNKKVHKDKYMLNNLGINTNFGKIHFKKNK